MGDKGIEIDESIGRRSASFESSSSEERIERVRLSLTDAVLISADHHVFPVHRVVLASVSPFFRTLFTGNFVEAGKRRVHLPLLSAKQIRQLIQFAYTGQLRVDASNVQTILDWATYSMMDELADQCAAFLIRHLTIYNCIEIYRFAEMRRLDVASAAWNMLIRRFDRVASTPEFQLLNEGELVRLLEEEQLNAAHDEQERRIVDMWLSYRTDRTASVVKLRSVLDSRRNADGVYRPRIPNSTLLAVCGWAHNGPTSFVDALDIRANRWIPADSTVSDVIPRAYHGIITLGNSMYIIGGFNGTLYFRSVSHFDLDTQQWSERGPMHHKRCYVSCVELDDGHLMAIGGYNGEGKRLKTVEVYDIERNQWSLVKEMNELRSDSHAVNIDGRVYVIGGFDGSSCEQSVEFFDSHKNAWYPMGKMLSARSGVGSVKLDGVVLAVGGYDGRNRLDSVEMFDPREGLWHRRNSMSTARSNFGIESIEGDIIVAGGYDGDGVTSLCERFDHRANKWAPAPTLNLPRSALYLTRIEEHDIVRTLCYPSLLSHPHSLGAEA